MPNLWESWTLDIPATIPGHSLLLLEYFCNCELSEAIALFLHFPPFPPFPFPSVHADFLIPIQL